MAKKIHIFGGGTVYHVRPHLALCAPAYGATARSISAELPPDDDEFEVQLHLTKMAGGGRLETNDDIQTEINKVLEDPESKMVFMTAALCDFNGSVLVSGSDSTIENIHGLSDMLTSICDPIETLSGKDQARLSSKYNYLMELSPANKIIRSIREKRKDIFLVGFKTTAGASQQEQYLAGLNLCKEASCNLVLANDIHSRLNMIVTPEEAAYTITTDRQEVLNDLISMALARSNLHFTRSTVVPGDPVSWYDERVPQSLRTVVDHCIKRGAYKPFRGVTAGHFAVKVNDNTFLTSRRKTNYNELDKVGLVKVETDGPDKVIAYGSKPSVGGQSQRIVFQEHPEYDCIVHFHCNSKFGAEHPIPLRSQTLIECGSHECGKNTSAGLRKFGNLSAVVLNNHGPNIVFNRNIDPNEVINFIEANFDLEEKSGGYQLGTN